jgi:serine/threonine protein kinase
MTALNAKQSTVSNITEVATGKESWLSAYIRAKLLFYQVYKYPVAAEPLYASSTTRVFRVEDYTHVRESQGESGGRQEPTRVVMKFMRRRADFLQERRLRGQLQRDTSSKKHIVSALRYHDGDEDEGFANAVTLNGHRLGFTGFNYCIVLESAECDLLSTLNHNPNLPMSVVRSIAREVAAALDYLHRQRVVHLDVTPRNIVFHDGSWKLVDFDAAGDVGADNPLLSEHDEVKCSAAYSPPEAFGETGHSCGDECLKQGCVTLMHGKFVRQASFDVWSFGAGE